MILKTPRLVRVEPFDDYLAHLSYSGRRKYRKTRGTYSEVPFDAELLARWMALWETQIVNGKRVKFRKYTPERYRREGWRLFRAEAALHPLLVCGDYCYGGPPLYDKREHPEMAARCWFGAIRWCAENGIAWFDLGGGSQKTWRGLLESPDRSYKWLYVQRDVKRNPILAQSWKVQVCRECGWRQLVYAENACSHMPSRR